MNVIFRIIRRIELYDPVNFWEIETSLGYICANQDSFLGLAELKVRRGSLLLLLLAMDVLDWNVDVV